MTKLIVAKMTDLYSASDPSMLVWNCDSIVLSEAIRDPGCEFGGGRLTSIRAIFPTMCIESCIHDSFELTPLHLPINPPPG